MRRSKSSDGDAIAIESRSDRGEMLSGMYLHRLDQVFAEISDVLVFSPLHNKVADEVDSEIDFGEHLGLLELDVEAS